MYCVRLWINELMMHLYSAFCVLWYTQTLYNHVGGLSSTTTSVQHLIGWCDGCHRTTAPVRSPHTSYRWRGEREIEPIKWMGIIRRPWLTRASGGNLARTPGLHPTLYEKCRGIFNDHRESLRLVMALVYCCSFDGLIASIILLICMSLWIKVSAKWLNVN